MDQSVANSILLW